MLLLSFEYTKSFSYENNLQYIAQDICFPSSSSRHYMWNTSLLEWEPQVIRLQTCVIMAAADQAVLNLYKAQSN